VPRVKAAAGRRTALLRQQRAPRAPVIEVQYAVSRAGVPHAASLRRWASAALLQPEAGAPRRARNRPASCTLRVVGAAEGRALNRRWRGKDKTTNVLSFPAGDLPEGLKENAPLGDIVICAPVIRREALEQCKTPAAHWAHMVIHGSLHLLGYDHEAVRDAAVMEQMERQILAGLGFPDPYLSSKDAKRR
jgi:probable rRNA maturation factor